jgi:drug/metabolite transporter (DMT)-like permease
LIGHGLVIFFALCAAVFMAIGIVVRQRATMDLPADDGVSTVMITTLLRRPIWWAGTGSAVLGYVFQALALSTGSLILVQPLLMSALLFTLPLSARLGGRSVTRSEWLWAGLLTIGLAVFVLLARPGAQDSPASLPVSIIVAICVGVLIVGCVVAAVRIGGWQRAALLAISVGVLFGVVAVTTKIVMHVANERGLLALLATPAPYALIVLGVIATLLQQSAFHAGALQMTVPTMLVLEPVVAVLLGAVVLGEQLEAGSYEAIVLSAAVIAMVAATVALGRGEGAYEEGLEMKQAREAA